MIDVLSGVVIMLGLFAVLLAGMLVVTRAEEKDVEAGVPSGGVLGRAVDRRVPSAGEAEVEAGEPAIAGASRR